MEKKSFSIGKYLCLGWLAIYLVISIFKFIQINYEINQKYGICAKKFMAVGYTNESIVIDYILLFLNRTVFPHFNPLYDYEVPKKMSSTIKLKAPFMESKFSITMRGGKIVEDNFYEVLSTDAKFQHLYSEWVKKQVGIEDENVELIIGFSKDSIDLKKIKSLSETYDEIFENCISESGLQRVYVKNIKDLSYENYKKIFYEIKEKYSLNNKINSENFIMNIYSFDTKLYNNNNYYGIPYNETLSDSECVIYYFNNNINKVAFYKRIDGKMTKVY